MLMNPYSELPPYCFWRTGVAQENFDFIKNIYQKKFEIHPTTKIATAGSCFAQHISSHLKKNGFLVLDYEKAPPNIPDDSHQKYGYSMYSARYGNIYTVKQLLQLTEEVAGLRKPSNYIWERNDRFFDALRPSIEPEGYFTKGEVSKNRRLHLKKVKEVLKDMDLLIFTLGLTEMWIDKEFGTVFPTAPGTIAGKYDKNIYEFKNAQFSEILIDFRKFQQTLKKIRKNKPYKLLLTVSPVPLTATASGRHVLFSTIYSKSILRAVAGQLSNNQKNIDYFPSYEIVNNPKLNASSFEKNLRTVKKETVEKVMKHFFKEHKPIKLKSSKLKIDDDLLCEDALLESFNTKNVISFTSFKKDYIQIVGNSFMAQFKESLLLSKDINKKIKDKLLFHSVTFLKGKKSSEKSIGHMHISPNDYQKNVKLFTFAQENKKPKKVILLYPRILGCFLLDRLGANFNNAENALQPKIASIFVQDNYEIYEKKIIRTVDEQIKSIEYILKFINPNNLRIVASPIYTEKSARFRLGDEFVDSKSFIYIKKIAEEYLNSKFNHLPKNIFIFHSNELFNETGFAKNKYHKHGKPLYDLHLNSEFYSGCVNQLKEFLNIIE